MTYHQGPWERESVSLDFNGFHREHSAASDNLKPHPIIAPIAWTVCLLGGAAFWTAIFRLIF